MNRRKFLKVTAASAVSCLPLSACAREYVRLRYRLKIVTRVAERLYEGSSVIEASIVDQRNFFLTPEASPFIVKSWGEAVVVDQREHGYLFGLLVPPAFHDGFSTTRLIGALAPFLPRDQSKDIDATLANLPRLQGEFVLPESRQPTLVRFRDILDPTTAESVDPSQFSETYGAGASFERATISLAQDPITRGIEQALPWLATTNSRGDGKLEIVSPQMSVAQLLSDRNFVRIGD